MNKFKKAIVLVLALMLCLSLGACGGKKDLPDQPKEEVAEGEHYKDTMVPFEEVEPSDRIVILQNTVRNMRDGFYTAETAPVAEDINYNGQTVSAYKMTYALDFLHNGYKGENTAYQVGSTEGTKLSAEELKGMYIIIDDFQSGNAPTLYNPSTGTTITEFDHMLTSKKEMILSIITEQDVNCVEMFEMVGWNTTDDTYHVVASDKFYIPITPEDYDDGELRGSLSGSINGTFPEMTIAQGKIGDIMYIEKVVK